MFINYPKLYPSSHPQSSGQLFVPNSAYSDSSELESSSHEEWTVSPNTVFVYVFDFAFFVSRPGFLFTDYEQNCLDQVH